MHIHEKTITISLLRQMVQNELNIAKNMLHNDLMYRFTPLLMPIATFEDDLDSELLGYSFLTDSRNALSQERDKLLDHILSLSPPSNLFESSTSWNVNSCNKWVRKCYDFRKHLLFLIHLTAGMPARASELSTIKICNTTGHFQSTLVLSSLCQAHGNIFSL